MNDVCVKLPGSLLCRTHPSCELVERHLDQLLALRQVLLSIKHLGRGAGGGPVAQELAGKVLALYPVPW